MKKINKKKKVTQNKTTKKNTATTKSKQQTKPKKVAQKTVAKKTVKKSIALKDLPKKIEKKKNATTVAKTKKSTSKILNKKTTIKNPVTNSTTTKPKLPNTKTKLQPIVKKSSKPKLSFKAEVVVNQSKPDVLEVKSNNVEENKPSPVLQSGRVSKQFLSEAELDGYRQKLITMRARLRGDVSTMTDAALNKNRMDASGDLSAVPIHMADVGSDNFEQEQTLSFMQSEHGILIDIDDALVRVKEGTYGICEGCGNSIPKVRLNFIPYVNMCVKCAELAQNQEGRDG
ncbi:MAG: TraR/DksA C4-type zinc finger protein [Planctomycetaceae bacterium]|jgi:DnaK suppressor protein|nr:TraR/DksA C4-type zinc finger protein [Planctomycetaceae bacterium]